MLVGCYSGAVATKLPLIQDRELPSSAYRYVHVHACKASCTKDVIEVIQYVFTCWRL